MSAGKNLQRWPHVRVVAGSGATRLAECDAIYVNAGATHLPSFWLESLGRGGRLVIPLTYAPASSAIGSGVVIAARKSESGIAARFVGPVAIYP